MKAIADVYHDEWQPKKNGKCAVKIKVTYLRKRKFYRTGITLTKDEYNEVMDHAGNGNRKSLKHKQIHAEIMEYLKKAQYAIDNLPIFTFDNFKELYLEKRNLNNSVSFAFDRYVSQLKLENRISTAISYETAKLSLEAFKKNLTFADITPTFLKKYENWMLQHDRSITTIGIYLRSLRAVYNYQNINSIVYPFGDGKGKYTIPTGKNIKKALTVEEISRIYNYEITDNQSKERAKDYWIFLYLCNGMNVKDFCLLKWGNIHDDILTYYRAKTKRSQKESKPITVALKPETWQIIKKWGQASISKDVYIFPHLNDDMTIERQHEIIKQLTKVINKYMNRIALELKLNFKLTTYFARHSFATVLKRSGAKIELISELLGHSSVLVTENYLDSFENDHIKEQTKSLTVGFNVKV